MYVHFVLFLEYTVVSILSLARLFSSYNWVDKNLAKNLS